MFGPLEIAVLGIGLVAAVGSTVGGIFATRGLRHEREAGGEHESVSEGTEAPDYAVVLHAEDQALVIVSPEGHATAAALARASNEWAHAKKLAEEHGKYVLYQTSCYGLDTPLGAPGMRVPARLLLEVGRRRRITMECTGPIEEVDKGELEDVIERRLLRSGR